MTEEHLESNSRGYFEPERRADFQSLASIDDGSRAGRPGRIDQDESEARMVDVVLSDMSAPWERTVGLWKRSLSDPYYRMMNTSGMNFRDHAGSMVRERLLDISEE